MPPPNCDVCGKKTEFSDSYALTTKQVVATHEYWEFAFSTAFSSIHKLEPNGGDMLMETIEGMASQTTGWLVCESCSKMFKFDRQLAKDYAARQEKPPDAGRIDFEVAKKFALVVWGAKYMFGSTSKVAKTKWWQFWK